MMKLNVVSWNIKGLGKRSRRLCVKDVCRKWKADILSLQVTIFRSFSRNLGLIYGGEGLSVSCTRRLLEDLEGYWWPGISSL